MFDLSPKHIPILFYPQGLPCHGVLVQLPRQPGGTPLSAMVLITAYLLADCTIPCLC